MPLNSYNPTRTQSTLAGPNVSAGALAQLQAQQQQQMLNAVQGLKGYGQASRTKEARQRLANAYTVQEIKQARGVGSLTKAGEQEYVKMLRDAQIQEDLNQQEQFAYSQQQNRFTHSDEAAKLLQKNKEGNIKMQASLTAANSKAMQALRSGNFKQFFERDGKVIGITNDGKTKDFGLISKDNKTGGAQRLKTPTSFTKGLSLANKETVDAAYGQKWLGIKPKYVTNKTKYGTKTTLVGYDYVDELTNNVVTIEEMRDLIKQRGQ